jgi:flagellar protein FliS
MNAARQQYLNDQVLTAPPQKLQLMLIDGAIRFGLQARALWDEGRSADACEALIRSQEIVVELLTAARQSGGELGRRASLEYLFVFQRLVASSLRMGGQPLADALRVLAEERETWRMVCEKLGAEAPGSEASALLAGSASPTRAVIATPPAPHWGGWSGSPCSEPAETGISFQA